VTSTRLTSARSEREQLTLFRALPGDLALRDVQDLMAYPFFSLAKTPRAVPIDFRMGEVAIRVEAVPEHGMATIWDADVLIWAASQLVEARDAGLRTSRLLAATPYEILAFLGRGDSTRAYQRLRAALDRLQSTTVATTLRAPSERRMHRFSWINEWAERADAQKRPLGIELILPDWFYRAVLDDALVLTIDPEYFHLTGGLERWLYRLVRKHGGRQRGGWRFDFPHLHAKSGSLSPFKRFAFELRDIARRQPLPGYRLGVERRPDGLELLTFARAPAPTGACGQDVSAPVLSVTGDPVPSGTADPCYGEPDPAATISRAKENRTASNLESNQDSNDLVVGAVSSLWKIAPDRAPVQSQPQDVPDTTFRKGHFTCGKTRPARTRP